MWAKGSNFDSEFTESVYNTMLIAPLERKSLEHIEKRRMGNRKKDVRLALNLNVKFIGNEAVISHLHTFLPKDVGLQPVKVRKHLGGTSDGRIVVFAHDSHFWAGNKNCWVISGDEKPIFLSIHEKAFKNETVRIPSTDWIHDYAPKLELGEYFIVEIAKGKKVIEEAWNYIEKAEKCYRQWDTKGVYGNCREVGSLLDTTIKKAFGKDSFIYKERWGRTYKRFKNISFSEFASLNLHLEDIKKSQKFNPEDVKIGKVDVEHIILITKALVKYAGELLQEKG